MDTYEVKMTKRCDDKELRDYMKELDFALESARNINHEEGIKNIENLQRIAVEEATQRNYKYIALIGDYTDPDDAIYAYNIWLNERNEK